MVRTRLSILLPLFLLLVPACADEEVQPAASTVLEAPELTAPREQRKSADPPPPIRERRLDTSPQSSQNLIPVYMAEPAPPSSASAPATQGTVNALDRDKR